MGQKPYKIGWRSSSGLTQKLRVKRLSLYGAHCEGIGILRTRHHNHCCPIISNSVCQTFCCSYIFYLTSSKNTNVVVMQSLLLSLRLFLGLRPHIYVICTVFFVGVVKSFKCTRGSCTIPIVTSLYEPTMRCIGLILPTYKYKCSNFLLNSFPSIKSRTYSTQL
jgi:hypothetical protein